MATVAVFASLAGCKVDPERPDAAAPEDAETADASEAADAGDACPGEIAYEVRAARWATGAPLAEVAIAQISDPANSATTDADGRGSLCVPEPAARVTHDRPDTLRWLAEVDGEAARRVGDAGAVFQAHLMTPAEADEVFSLELGLARDPTAAIVAVEVRTYPDGEPLKGARVELAGAAFAGVYTGSPAEEFSPGNTLEGGDLVVFANVEPGPPQAEVIVSPPTGFDGACAGPEAAAIAGGAFTHVLVACERAF